MKLRFIWKELDTNELYLFEMRLKPNLPVVSRNTREGRFLTQRKPKLIPLSRKQYKKYKHMFTHGPELTECNCHDCGAESLSTYVAYSEKDITNLLGTAPNE